MTLSRRALMASAVGAAGLTALAATTQVAAQQTPVTKTERRPPSARPISSGGGREAEIAEEIGPSRVIICAGLIVEVIETLDNYMLFDSPEERRLITLLEEALRNRGGLEGLRDGLFFTVYGRR